MISDIETLLRWRLCPNERMKYESPVYAGFVAVESNFMSKIGLAKYQNIQDPKVLFKHKFWACHTGNLERWIDENHKRLRDMQDGAGWLAILKKE